MWGELIDRSLLESSINKEVVGYAFQLASKFEKELHESEKMVELCQMKYKLSAGEIKRLVALFIKEQDAFGKTYITLNDCIKHFTYWINHNKDKTAKPLVKSAGKLLR